MEKKIRWIRRRSQTPGCFPRAVVLCCQPSTAIHWTSAGMDRERDSGGRKGASTVRCPRQEASRGGVLPPAPAAGARGRSHLREALSPVVRAPSSGGGGCQLPVVSSSHAPCCLRPLLRPVCAQGPSVHSGDWRQ